MDRRKYLNIIRKLTYRLEVIISILLFLGIIISVPDIFRYYYEIFNSDIEVSYVLFQKFLSHILILVIGLEFIMLMIAHNDVTIVHLMSLVIARKMLVQSSNVLDLLIGVAAIVLLFATKRYLIESNFLEENESNEFSARIKIEELNKKYDYNIDDKNSITLGGLVSKLLEAEGVEPELGTLVDDGKYMYEIKKASNGILELISIDHIK